MKLLKKEDYDTDKKGIENNWMIAKQELKSKKSTSKLCKTYFEY